MFIHLIHSCTPKELLEPVLDRLRKEAEDCDMLQGKGNGMKPRVHASLYVMR